MIASRIGSVPSFLSRLAIPQLFTRRGLLILAGVFIFTYAVAVLIYVQSIPDIGLKSIFSPVVKGTPRFFSGTQPREGDIVLRVGNWPVNSWADLLGAPFVMQQRLASGDAGPWVKTAADETMVEVELSRPGPTGAKVYTTWARLGRLPPEDLVPSLLWFCLKMMLFLVGALVLWNRPQDSAAAQFFLLCIFTVGAYMGGYHWPYIATNYVLLLVFDVCAIMLPAVSLHFYLMFPRKKRWLQRRPRLALAVIYGPSVVFLLSLFGLYLWHQSLYHGGGPSAQVVQILSVIRLISSCYLVVASLLYLFSITSLVHSFRWAADATERKQVQWILCGAVLALVPIGYSFYLALFNPDAFGAGAATWPMFTASILLTVAFGISITRYRLMELDQIVSSGVGYFLISFLAGLVYYVVVFVGMLVFNASPQISEALTVSTTALVLMLVLDLARSRLKKALDRRFTRDKSQLDRTLQKLGQAIEQLVDPQVLAKRLLQASTEHLGVTRGAVFLRQGEPSQFKLAGSSGESFSLTELPCGCPLIEALERGQVLVDRYRPGASATPAQRQLRFLGGEIAQPLTHEGRLLALLVLGHRDAPYREEDLTLLAAFAQITVLALESAEGHRTIEQLNQELQTKVDKISEQQRRILTLQSQLKRHLVADGAAGKGVGNGSNFGHNNGKEGEPAADAAGKETAPGGIVGSGPVVRQLLHLVHKVAVTDAVILIRGESGTGKELLARAVHETSPRAGKPFVKVHCAALSPGLLESELFGHVKGAFTGAHRDKIGRFELANGGTLFLDEIGDISLEVQTKLLRVLQEKAFERVGSSDPVTVDVRIITATHQNLEQLIRQGRFREDLFYRLNVFPIQVPPLRDRREDVPELAGHFIRMSSERCNKSVTYIDDDALAMLKAHSWPGNIRQLENMIERAVVIAEGPTISVHELPGELVRELDGMDGMDGTTADDTVTGNGKTLIFDRNARERQERDIIAQALAAANGNKAEAARALGLARSTLLSRLKKLGLDKT